MGTNQWWAADELWEEVLLWRSGGLTYAQIRERLAAPDTMKRFGLHDVPSESTVAREVRRRGNPADSQTRRESNP